MMLELHTDFQLQILHCFYGQHEQIHQAQTKRFKVTIPCATLVVKSFILFTYA